MGRKGGDSEKTTASEREREEVETVQREEGEAMKDKLEERHKRKYMK